MGLNSTIARPHNETMQARLKQRTHWLTKKSDGIYVEIPIRTSLDKLWHFTQTPDLHAQWDLRFTTIDYLPQLSPDEPQKFKYATRIGFGLRIVGTGESVAMRVGRNQTRTSSLKFWSDHPLSLIKHGSGYWHYKSAGDHVIFSTWYTYDVRFGVIGQVFDRWIFRPMLGWATALSFDCLRIWLEERIPPQVSLRNFMLRRNSKPTATNCQRKWSN